MNRNKYLSSRLQELFLDGKWIAGTNLKELLENISWEDSIAKVADHNSIAELTFHINYYIGGVLNVLEGGDLEIRDKYSFDMDPINNESDWKKLLETFLSNAGRFINAVAGMDDTLFDQPFVKKEYGSYERNIEGLIEHSYYHFGQLSLIKKLLKRS